MHFLRHYIVKFIDCILPPRDAELRLRTLTPSNFPFSKIDFKTEHGMRVLALSTFTDESVRNAIHELKFHNSAYAAMLYTKNLCDALQKICGEHHSEYLIVPIPLHKKRHRARGHNQVTTVLIASLTSTQKSPLFEIFRESALTRIRETKPQTELSREARIKNLQHAFLASSVVSDKNIIVVDDVYTTGATCREAQRALLHAGARRVTCVILAKA